MTGFEKIENDLYELIYDECETAEEVKEAFQKIKEELELKVISKLECFDEFLNSTLVKKLGYLDIK